MIKDRDNNVVRYGESKQEKILELLYGNPFGRMLIKPLISPKLSAAVGKIMDSRLSKPLVKPFIRSNGIDVNDFEMSGVNTFNKAFSRKIKDGKRPVDMKKESFISPCDAKLSVYEISKDSTFKIKNSIYSVSDLVKSKKLAEKYLGGWCMIFRLECSDYHRYCYVDNGCKGRNFHIKGQLHTVNPIALRKYNIYKRNSREFTVLHTQNFGDITQIEVGAMLVGKIANHHSSCTFKKGQEKGMFLYGGSTIVLLVQKNKVMPCYEFLRNTEQGCETIVRYGEKIGVRYNVYGATKS